jgi:hypothetical protein
MSGGQVSVTEYLRTSYRPDREYVDGGWWVTEDQNSLLPQPSRDQARSGWGTQAVGVG